MAEAKVNLLFVLMSGGGKHTLLWAQPKLPSITIPESHGTVELESAVAKEVERTFGLLLNWPDELINLPDNIPGTGSVGSKIFFPVPAGDLPRSEYFFMVRKSVSATELEQLREKGSVVPFNYLATTNDGMVLIALALYLLFSKEERQNEDYQILGWDE